MKLFLTGGTGFFGKALLRYLVANSRHLQSRRIPFNVVVLTRSPERFLAENFEFSGIEWLTFHLGDVLDTTSLPKGSEFSHVLHAAGNSTDVGLTPVDTYRQIVDGTRNVLDLAIATGAQRFLLTSSGGVYGRQPKALSAIPESYHGMPDPLSPLNVYGVAKRQAEHLCALYQGQYGLETTIARCFAFLGRDLPIGAHFAIGNFMRDALFNSEIIVCGDGSPIRSYLDQRDLADWLMTLLENGQKGQAYNVGSDEVISIHDLAYLVRDVLAPEKSVRILGQLQENKDRNVYVPDVSKALEELGLRVKFTLSEAIKDAAKYWSSHEN